MEIILNVIKIIFTNRSCKNIIPSLTVEEEKSLKTHW